MLEHFPTVLFIKGKQQALFPEGPVGHAVPAGQGSPVAQLAIIANHKVGVVGARHRYLGAIITNGTIGLEIVLAQDNPATRPYPGSVRAPVADGLHHCRNFTFLWVAVSGS